jgi:hypothetical protein
MTWRTIVLKDRATDIVALGQRIDALLAEAGAQHGFRFAYEGQRGDPGGVTIDYWSVEPAGAIQLAVDWVLEVLYLSLNVTPDDVLAQLASYFGEQLASFSIEELKAEVRAAVGDSRASLFRLALALREFDSESYDLICHALHSSDSATRNGAARGAAVLRWSELLDPLRVARATERDAETARILDLAIRASAPRAS